MNSKIRRMLGGVAMLAIFATAVGCGQSPMAPDSATLSPSDASFSKGGHHVLPGGGGSTDDPIIDSMGFTLGWP